MIACSASGSLTSSTRMITGASLTPDSASSVPASRALSGTRRSVEKIAAASVDDRIAPHSTASCHRRSSDVVRDHRDDRDADADADRRERERERQPRPDRLPAGGDAALGQDDHQRGDADRLRELEVVERDQARAAERRADAEVEQQAGQSGAGRQPDRDDRDDQDRSTDEQGDVQLVDGHLLISTPPRRPRRRRGRGASIVR